MGQAVTPNGLNFFELQTAIIPSSRRWAVSAPVSSDCKLNSLPCSIAASHCSFRPHLVAQLHYQPPLALPLLPQRSLGPRQHLPQVPLQPPQSHLCLHLCQLTEDMGLKNESDYEKTVGKLPTPSTSGSISWFADAAASNSCWRLA